MWVPKHADTVSVGVHQTHQDRKILKLEWEEENKAEYGLDQEDIVKNIFGELSDVGGSVQIKVYGYSSGKIRRWRDFTIIKTNKIKEVVGVILNNK